MQQNGQLKFEAVIYLNSLLSRLSFLYNKEHCSFRVSWGTGTI